MKLKIITVLVMASTLCYGQDYLYGLTQYGGTYNKGVPYQIATDGTKFISYTDFDGNNGEHPGNGAGFTQFNVDLSPFVLSGMSALTEFGDQGKGQRVQIVPGKGGLIPSFPAFHFDISYTGSNPGGRFLFGADKVMYGLTSSNAKFGGGALFSFSFTAATAGRGPMAFNGVDGKSPKGSLIQGSDGKIYGMTELGGVNDKGVIFSYDNTGLMTGRADIFSKLLDFDGVNKGSYPTGNLLLASDGRLYGMTRTGGTHDSGVIFSILTDGTGFTKLLDFDGVSSGAEPKGSLTEFTDGKLYGMTSSGGANGFGTIFNITLAGSFEKVFDFDGANGKSPVGDLLVAPNGTVMYGVTYAGGATDSGVLFKLENGNQFTKLYDYSAATGSNPVGALSTTRQVPKINFPPIDEKNTLSEPFLPVVESSANMPVYLISSDPSVAIIENNQVKIKGAGVSYIMAFQLGNHKYLPQSAGQYITVSKVRQTITFDPIPSKTFEDPSFAISATSSSGLPVEFSVFSAFNNVASISGNIVSIVGGGTVSIRARQLGNSIYEPASDVFQNLVVNRAEQTINFQPTPVRVCCQSFDLSATASSKLAVSFKIVTRDKLTIIESRAYIKQVGMAEIVAYQKGNASYNPAELKMSVNILKGEQSISFNIPGGLNATLGDPAIFIGAGANSGLPVTYTSSPPGIAVMEGGYLFFVGVGTTTITATQGGNTLFNPAVSKSATITVKQVATPATDNIITWKDLTPQFITGAPFNLTASANSGLPISYSSSNSSVAVVTGNLVTLTGVGSTTITASQIGNTTIPVATPIQKVLQVNKQGQSINFSDVSPVNYGADPISLQLTSSADLPIEYTSSNSSVASVEDFYIHFNGDGVATITATQAGNGSFLPAQEVSRLVRVNQTYQTIAFDPLPEKVYGDAPFKLFATTSSGRPVTYSSSDESIASIVGSEVTIKKGGTVTIKATQNGIPGYTLSEVTQQLIINKRKQTITFAPLSAKEFSDVPFLISATSDSGLPVIFTSATPAVAKVSGNSVSITGNGMVAIVASQPGNESYLPAQPVSQSFQVNDAGNTYDLIGSTQGGGPNNSGVIYTMNSEGAGFNLIKQFDVRTVPLPQGGLIKGADGRMYGNLYWGGLYNNGRIIRLEADGTGFTVLHDYQYSTTGASPFGNLVQADNGELYGMTRAGGFHGAGTIFRIKTDGTGFTVLYHFSQVSGGSPMGGLMQASNGKLYGMTQGGGFFGSGTIFSLNTDGSAFAVIFNINDSAPVRSGYYPRGDLVQGADGFLYGTMQQGGNATNDGGSLFKIQTDGSNFTKVIQFDGSTFGAKPSSTLLVGSDGKLYGMTQTGGSANLGTIYSVNTDGTNYTRLLNFVGEVNGATPLGKLTEAANGSLYGMTNGGGVNSKGTIFTITKSGTGFQKMLDLDARAALPVFGSLVESTPDTFFGMTSNGGPSNGGVIFSISSGGVFNVIKDFPQGESSPSNLISDPLSEYYYGIVWNAGHSSIFRTNASGSSYQRILELPVDISVTKLFYITTGHLWCIASQNGARFIFSIKTDGTEFQRVVDFDNAIQKGISPLWLVETSTGYVFGNATGGTNSSALIFKIKNDGTGFNKVMDMPAGIEVNPGQFILASDGNFYGCTTYHSILYRFDEAGTYKNIFTFPQDAGEVPMKIMEMNGGSLGIVTRDHGTGDHGRIFTVNKDGSSYSKIYDPVMLDGTSPVDMVQTTDGWIYVAAQYGGDSDKGVVFKVRGDGSSFTKVHQFIGSDGDIPNSLIFRKAGQSFTFGPLPEMKTSDPAFVPETSSTSGAPVQLSSSNLNVAIIENGKIKPVGVGTVMITASLPASTNFFKAADIQQQLVVVKGDQSISFEALTPVIITDLPFELKAVATSGLPVSYESSNVAVATISGKTVTIIGVGSTVIKAVQAGNDNFFAAVSVQQTLTVKNGGSQSIAFVNPGSKVLSSTPFQISATATSGLPVEYSSTSSNISLVGQQVTMLAAGSVTIKANQPGNADFKPAPPVQVVFCVNPLKPSIAITGAAPDFTLVASNLSGNQWYKNGTILPGSTASTLLPNGDGNYTVVTTIEGCASETSDPQVITTTGIQNDTEVQLSIFPNPVTHELHVEISGDVTGSAILHLIDNTGRSLEFRQIAKPGIEIFDLRTTANGLYLIKVELNGNVYLRKVLKQ